MSLQRDNPQHSAHKINKTNQTFRLYSTELQCLAPWAPAWPIRPKYQRPSQAQARPKLGPGTQPEAKYITSRTHQTKQNKHTKTGTIYTTQRQSTKTPCPHVQDTKTYTLTVADTLTDMLT